MRINFRGSLLLLAAAMVAACQQSIGPTRKAIDRAVVAPAPGAAATGAVPAGLRLVDITDALVTTMNRQPVPPSFAALPGDARAVGSRVGVGDAVAVTIWEAPPAVLFGSGFYSTKIDSPISASQSNQLPEMLVGPTGTINVPFAGQVPAAGRTLQQIEQTIVARLRGKANAPQAIVRLVRNATANVTIGGDVAQPARVPLTPKGERLLDVIAAAGGASKPVSKLVVQLTRGNIVNRMPLQQVVDRPADNIVLRADDVITLQYQPYSFTAMGAAGKTDEVPFEAVGISLAQALGRVGGIADGRADAKGVFIFRYESADLLPGDATRPAETGAGARVPTVYRIDLRQTGAYFVTQNFQMRNGDVLYVATSPTAEFQRFISLLGSGFFPLQAVRSVI